ncbi:MULTISPECIES: hypothetical protein [unclassified Haladaptatus]|uniref:hypothetical protein n=1 Tax=unclassified Haladaptatus TaxID=2622732 RepID=UPI00209C4D9C|nr:MULTISPECIES: hypothetical protein [unclassified Haladaptatus]MCO8244341.1 hypothetical protein [Haladaptatus sp. AB643]MCO8254035.1 hypothetical protein [Haladaptatus sp. AB618]
MNPSSRRTFLATVGVSALAGCSALRGSSSDDAPPDYLSGHVVSLADGVELPDVSGLDEQDDPADADIALFPAKEVSEDDAARALAIGTPVAFVGDGAPLQSQRTCTATGKRYGIPGDGWGSGELISAIVPADGRLDTQRFMNIELPDDVPWAVNEILTGHPPDSDVSVNGISHADSATELGRTRIRGRTQVGAFDRWKRATAVLDGSPPHAIVDTVATIESGREVAGHNIEAGYHADRVKVVSEFDEELESTVPDTGETDSLTISETERPKRGSVTHSFEPRTDDARKSFTVATRSRIHLDSFSYPFDIHQNVRFNWRKPGLLHDETWTQHTPGRSLWDRGK